MRGLLSGRRSTKVSNKMSNNTSNVRAFRPRNPIDFIVEFHRMGSNLPLFSLGLSRKTRWGSQLRPKIDRVTGRGNGVGAKIFFGGGHTVEPFPVAKFLQVVHGDGNGPPLQEAGLRRPMRLRTSSIPYGPRRASSGKIAARSSNVSSEIFQLRSGELCSVGSRI
jgi:hypothetical protein